MRKSLTLLPLMFVMAACVHAQQAKVGGTGAVGGTSRIQGSGAPAMFISTSGLPDATANTSYTQTLAATNGVGALTWTILLGQLPTGLALNSSTGVISGTPTTPGISTFTVLVTDSTSPTAQTATKQFSLSVDCAHLEITSTSPLPGATSGATYNFQFLSAGGFGTITWTGTGLPTGLSLSSSGALTGSTTVVGTSTLRITATDSCPVVQTAQEPFTLAVAPTVTIVTASPLAPGTAGVAYQQQFAAQGGTSPYTWTVTGGSLPAGLALSAPGILSGTPTAVGTFTFTVQVVDNVGTTTSAPFTLVISCATLSITSNTTLPNGTQQQPYSFQFTSSGGQGTVTWSVGQSSVLPNGLALSSSGALTGTPTVSGTSTFAIAATDSCSTPQVAGANFTLTVNNALTITTATPLPAATAGLAYNAQMSVTGGTPPYQWSVPSGTFPAGAIDMLDYALMPLPARNTSHMSGSTVKYFHLDGGMFWWLKGATGNPWDGELYDAQFIYHWFTEDGDAADQPACIAAGFASCFLDPSASKTFVTPVPLAPRYFVPGTTVTILTPATLSSSSTLNPYIRTTNCGVDAQPLLYLGNIKTVTSGPTNVAFGGSIGTAPTIEIDYYYSGNVSGVYQSRERYYLAKGFGQVQWDVASWNGTTYVVSQTSTNNNMVAGGAPTPNFACKVPTLPITGGLPPGAKITSAPQLNLSDSTGAISGTPTTTGTYSFNVQAEDSAGLITQKTMSLTTSCAPLSLTTTSPLPTATQGQAYTLQLLNAGGLSPFTWAIIQGTLPAGLSLSSTGSLSGTPTATGTFTFVAQVLDSCSPQQQSAQTAFSLAVQANSGALTITTSSPLPGATEGTAYVAPVSATGGTPPYAWTISAGSLPAGLSISPTTGSIAGTPTTTVVASFTVQVTDSLSVVATKAFNLTVTCPTFSLTSTSPLPAATQNQAYSFQFTSTGGILPITWSGTSIPAGLAISTSGLLSGTPTGTGTSSLNISAHDSCVVTPQVVSNSFSLTINAAPPALTITTTSPLPVATQGVAYNTQMAATGGTPPYTWTLLSGSFPAGLSIGAGGVISGTATTIGTSTPTIKVTDSLGVTTNAAFSITVSCVALSITTTSPLPSGTQSSPYSFQMTSAGGAGAQTWSLFGGAFPTGMSIASTGLISGTPSANGTFSPQIRVTDSCSTPQTATTTFTQVINPATVPLQITSTSPLPAATQNSVYSVTLTATGGTPPYSSWTVTVGTLPTGLSIAASTGIISGTPTVVGTSSFTVRVSDSVAATATAVLSITVNAATGADNRYCNSNNQVVNLTADGPAQPLQQCLNTAIANTPSTGTVRGPVTTASAFATQYAAASCGDVIQITAGSVLTPITLTGKSCTAGHWITVESTGISDGTFPAEGTRLTPCQTNMATFPNRPPYSCPTPKLLTAAIVAPNASNAIVLNGADHIRFIGLEITRATTQGIAIFNLVDLTSGGTQTNHIIFDRDWFHGVDRDGQFPMGSSSVDTSTTRAIYLGQSNNVGVIDSYFSDFYDTGSTAANGNSDAQCMGGGVGNIANSGWGVYKFVNNHCEASGEGILLGGANGPALTPAGCTITVNCNLDVPTDLEVRRNNFFKPLTWNGNTTTVASFGWPVAKNGFEMKVGARGLFEGNIITNTWYSAQVGWCWSIAPKNQSGGNPLVGTAPTALTNDFTYRYNYCYNVAYGIGLYQSMDSGCSSCQAQGANRISIHDNLIDWLNVGNLGTQFSSGDGTAFTAALDSSGRGLNKIQNVNYSNNTIVRAIRYAFAIGADAAGQLNNWTFQNNIWAYGNFGVGANPSTGGCVSTADSGNNFNLLLTGCINGTVNTWTADHNALFNQPGTLGNGWPTNTHGLNNFFCSGVTSGSCINLTGGSFTGGIGFTNYNGGNSGGNPANYIILNTSPLFNAGSNGQSLGANIQLLNTNIAGVQ